MKKFTKILAILLALVFVFSFAACGNKTDNDGEKTTAPESDAGSEVKADYSNIKFGLICLHDENSTYDNNFISALKEVQKELGLSDDQILIKTNIPETDACLSAAEELIDEGCNIIFADSFGHETYILQAAQ